MGLLSLGPPDALHISLEMRKYCFISQFTMSNYILHSLVIYSSVCLKSSLHLLWKFPMILV